MIISLRPVEPADLEVFFANEQHPEAVWMAAFVPAEWDNQALYDTRMRRILADETIMVRTILCDGEVAGSVLKYVVEHPEVSYWIGREHWGQGVATEALRQFLVEFTPRPVRARAAKDNTGSLAVLAHNGFRIIAEDIGPAAGRMDIVEEYLLELTA